ncbi:MAG TPA: rhomboid family intramembrane serine protease [Mycobacteriales bacterium]|nr:rhomboid family intramembrane serine protease [Mycobacteriales bacterium]
MTAPSAPPVCYRHPGQETYVACTRCERPICPDCMHAASVGFHCPDCVRAGTRSVRAPRSAFGGRAVRSADVTIGLIAINVGVFVATAAGGTSLAFAGGSSPLYLRFALIPGFIAEQHQYYRLLTSMFLHFGLAHIAFNMLALFYVGPTLERALGRVRYLALYLLAGLGGSVLSYLLGSVGQASAGASGAIFGLFAALFVVLRRQGLDPRGVVGLIAINLVFTFASPFIDKWGHVGGLATGAVLAWVLAYAPRGPRRSLVQGVGAGIVCLLLVAVTALRTAALT